MDMAKGAGKRRRAVVASLVALGVAVVLGVYALVTDAPRAEAEGESPVAQGADLIVVAEGNAASYDGLILSTEPSAYYLAGDILAEVGGVDGVVQASPQLYVASVGDDCCAAKTQVVGLDPSADFSVQPLVEERYTGSLEDGGLIVGSGVMVDDGPALDVLGTEVPVVARLAETGTDLDHSAFATLDTARSIGDAGEEESLSAVLVRVADGSDAHQVAQAIEGSVDGVRVIEAG